MNNFQKIKEMNIDELAVFLFGGRCSRCAYFGNICNGSFFDEKSCTTGITKFLAIVFIIICVAQFLVFN